jgi:hypothetical protein
MLFIYFIEYMYIYEWYYKTVYLEAGNILNKQ